MTGHDIPDETTHHRRSWWPALIGAGLVAAAVIGVIAIRSNDTETTPPVATEAVVVETTISAESSIATTTPESTTTALAPGAVEATVDGGCIIVSTAAGTARGCPQYNAEFDQVEQRTFVADLDGAVLVTTGADPFVDLVATVDDGTFALKCRWNDLAPRVPEGTLVEVVVCNDTGVMGVTTAQDSEQDSAISSFTLPTPFLPDGAELGAGMPVEGLPGALSFVAPVDEYAACTMLLMPDRTGWAELCDVISEPPLDRGIVFVDPTNPSLYEITIGANRLVTVAQRLDAMSPSSGCSIKGAVDLVGSLPASSIMTGIGCIGDDATMTTGSVLAQEGPPDGSIWVTSRDADGIWAITDSGTGLDEVEFSFPIVPSATWLLWPETTVPDSESRWSDPIAAIDTQSDVDAFTDELLASLATQATEPEFPLNERAVEVQPNGLPLIIAQVDIGGDDSIGGAVLYVWLEEVFDDSGPIGWRASNVLVGNTCLRGIDAASGLCV